MMANKDKLLEESNILVNDKLRNILAIYEINQKQIHLLDDEPEDFVDKLNDYVEKKETLIFDINSIDDQFISKFESLKSILPNKNLDTIADNQEFKNLQITISKIFDTLNDIKELDGVIIKKMNHKHSKIKNEIKKLNDMNSTSKYISNQASDLDKGFYLDQRK